MITSDNVGIVFNPHSSKAKPLAVKLWDILHLKDPSWLLSTPELGHGGLSSSTALIITVGGDGTILSANQVAAPLEIPILGVNLGRVGFMTELSAEESLTKVWDYMRGDARIETRTMLEAEVISDEEKSPPRYLHALNDVVVGRDVISRLVHLEVKIDGATLITYRADGVIVATATGSTGYSIAAGGPILHPQSRDLLISPVATHLGLSTSLVLSPDSTVEIGLRSDFPGVMSVDGRTDIPLSPGDSVGVKRSTQSARFLRMQPYNHFYATLTNRLNPDTRVDNVSGGISE